jgi:hypothetical protein
MSSRHCFENRTYHIYKEHDKNPRCCNESSEYIQKLKFGVVMNENCQKVSVATSGLSADDIARSFGRVYPNQQLRNDIFDISCNKVKPIHQ